MSNCEHLIVLPKTVVKSNNVLLYVYRGPYLSNWQNILGVTIIKCEWNAVKSLVVKTKQWFLTCSMLLTDDLKFWRPKIWDSRCDCCYDPQWKKQAIQTWHDTVDNTALIPSNTSHYLTCLEIDIMQLERSRFYQTSLAHCDMQSSCKIAVIAQVCGNEWKCNIEFKFISSPSGTSQCFPQLSNNGLKMP